MMDNAEEVMHLLEEFSKLKPKIIPRELEDYLGYVAKTGDPVFKWSMVKFLFREKMLSVINDFYEDTLTIDLPPCPNVDAFNYDRMKSNLLERLEAFHGAPFTIQRICELLTNPRKEYNRADKFMRAVEKNILVVTTREPGRYSDLDCESVQECSINGIREVGDSLDSSFMINDLGGGPDSSSPHVELHDSLPDANHLSPVERVSPVHEQDVSSDSDSISLEKSRSSEKVNGLETGHCLSSEENDGSNVSSTDMNILQSNSAREMTSDEVSTNPVTSSHETVISNQQLGFVVGASLNEVIGSTESPVEGLESCILPDGTLLNEVINESSEGASKQESHSAELSKLSNSEGDVAEEKESSEIDVPPPSDVEAVECDTSETERISVCDDGVANSDIPTVNQCKLSCEEQVTSCDTTQISSQMTYQVDSADAVSSEQSDPLSSISQTEDELVLQSDNSTQTNVVQSELNTESDSTPEADTLIPSKTVEESDLAAQSEVAPQSDNLAESAQVEPEVSVSHQLDTADQLDLVEQSSEVAQSHVSSENDVSSENASQCEQIAQSDLAVVPEPQAKSDESIGQSDASSLDTGAQSDVLSQSGVDSQYDLIEQYCADHTASVPSPTDDVSQSSLVDTDSDSGQPQMPDQTEQIIQMDIPSPSENEAITMEPSQSGQIVSAPSEPMDVDE